MVFFRANKAKITNVSHFFNTYLEFVENFKQECFFYNILSIIIIFLWLNLQIKDKIKITILYKVWAFIDSFLPFFSFFWLLMDYFNLLLQLNTLFFWLQVLFYILIIELELYFWNCFHLLIYNFLIARLNLLTLLFLYLKFRICLGLLFYKNLILST